MSHSPIPDDMNWQLYWDAAAKRVARNCVLPLLPEDTEPLDVQYVAATVCDQTWTYFTPEFAENGKACITIVHAEARLFSSLEAAERFAREQGDDTWVEVVLDEAEFKSRQGTW